MKITELISELQVILAAEGDIEVGVEREVDIFVPLTLVECRNPQTGNVFSHYDDDPALGARFVGLQ